MDFEISITREDIAQVRDFFEDSEVVDLMNDAGLSFPAMAFVLQKIYDACNEVEEQLGETGDDEE